MRWGRSIRKGAFAILFGVLTAASALPAGVAAAPTARPADAFVEAIGVNIHTSSVDTPYYNQFGAVKERLAELGVRHIRDEIEPDAPPGQYKALTELAQLGVRSTLILGNPDNGLSGLDQLVADVETELAGAVEAVEGPNEWSTSGDSEWKSNLVAYQEHLFEGIEGNPLLAELPVLGPSIAHGDQQELGDISASLDYGNIHSYPEGNAPEYRMGLNVERAEFNSGSKPIMATETGYTNALKWTPSGPGENKPISEEGAAIYMPRLFFEYWIRHLVRTFSYELLDQRPDPGLEDREEHFGLLRNDLSRKPAFVALRNTIEILEDPGPAFAPGPLAYSLVDEGTATLHHALLQKRDGTFYLALWRLQSVWNPDEKKALDAPNEPVTLQVEPGVASYAVYTPTLSSEPVSSISLPSESVTVDVGPQVVILELSPSVPVQRVTASPSASPAPVVPVAPQASDQPHCVVPHLRGRSLAAARRRARRRRCRIGRVRRLAGATLRAGRVVRQRPRPSETGPVGRRISVTLR